MTTLTTYQDIPTLHSLNDEIRGRLTVILGASGSGKSVLKKLIAMREGEGIPIYCVDPEGEYNDMARDEFKGVVVHPVEGLHIFSRMSLPEDTEMPFTSLDARLLRKSRARHMAGFIESVYNLSIRAPRPRLLMLDDFYPILSNEAVGPNAVRLLKAFRDHDTTVVASTQNALDSINGAPARYASLIEAADFIILLRQNWMSPESRIGFLGTEYAHLAAGLVDLPRETGLLLGPDGLTRFDFNVTTEEEAKMGWRPSR